MAETDNLDAAIRDAVEKNPPPPDPTHLELMKDGNEKIEEKIVEKPKEEKAEVVEETIEADPEEVKHGLNLLRALQDPAKRAELINSLADNAGYDLTKKAEQKQLIRDAKTILKEKLGDNYELLSGDKLAEAVEEMVAIKTAELTKPHLDKFSRAEANANQQKADTAMEAFFTRHEIPKDQREAVSQKLMTKMQVMPATPETHVDTYLDDLYFLTHRDASAAKQVKKTVDKIKENAKEAKTSGDESINEDRIKRGSKMPSLDESVRAAYRGLKLDQ